MLTESVENSNGWFNLPPFLGGNSSSGSGDQAPPRQTRHSDEGKAGSEDSEETDFLASLKETFASFENLGDKIGDAILPSWVKLLPGFVRKLHAEFSMAPGSLADEIWSEANDVECNPEIMWEANVRVSEELCKDEVAFLRRRKQRLRRALARYIDVPVEDIHPDDIPTIAICGSGGGLRAMVAGTSSLLSAAEDGLFDCATYTAGVSGSCWQQALFYSSIGRQDHSRIINHLKSRLGIHIAFPPAALPLLTSAPTNKYLLGGMVEKLRGLVKADFGLVDIYGVLLAARLMVPKGELGIDYRDLKVSDQARYLETGAYPLPIYTAVRHEIPDEATSASTEEVREAAKKEAWFQWFEWTPYEFFCEEMHVGSPTWAAGRTFDGGKTAWRENGLALPELRIPILLGIWGSAFCATLSHYYKEVRPILSGLAGFKGVDELISQKSDDMVKLHPIDPATIPNFALNMRDSLPSSCPESVHTSTHLQLMDAGMSNNLPIYPLLRPKREVDMIVAFDASADVRKDNWLAVTDGYVRQRGIKGWPMGSGWPPEDISSEQAGQQLEKASETNPEQAGIKTKPDSGLGYCTVWVGSKQERIEEQEPPRSKAVSEDWELTEANAGVAVVYFPLLANDAAPGVDPQKSDYLSTWNFVYTPQEIDEVVKLARVNYAAGRDQTRRAVKAVWQRKRLARLKGEDGDWSQHRYGGQGDQFS